MRRSIRLEKKGFEICRFRHGGVDGVIRPLKSLMDETQVSAAPPRGAGDDPQEFVRFQMMRTGTGHEKSAGPHQLEAQFIDAAIGFQALFRILAALDERRRIKAYHIEIPARTAQLGQQRQPVALQRFRFVQTGSRRVASRELQRRG